MAQTRNVSIYGAAIAVEETLVSLSAQLESAGAAEAAAVYAGLAKDVGQCAQVADAFFFFEVGGLEGWYVVCKFGEGEACRSSETHELC